MTSREQLRGLMDQLCKHPEDETLLAVLADAMTEAEAEDIRYVLMVFISRHRTDLICNAILESDRTTREKITEFKRLDDKEMALNRRIRTQYADVQKSIQQSCSHLLYETFFSHGRPYQYECRDCGFRSTRRDLFGEKK